MENGTAIGLSDLIDRAVRAGDNEEARELAELFDKIAWLASDTVLSDVHMTDAMYISDQWKCP